MAGKALKAGGKRVMKYSRDGAVERDLLQQFETRISGRTEDAVLKTEAPADELFGKGHKPQEQAEQPKHHKPRFIDEQQDTGSKLQADYATHTDTKETAKPDNSGGNNSMILIIGAALLIGGGAFYYFKIYKGGKAKAPKKVVPDDDEEEEPEFDDPNDAVQQETNDSDE